MWQVRIPSASSGIQTGHKNEESNANQHESSQEMAAAAGTAPKEAGSTPILNLGFWEFGNIEFLCVHVIY